MFLDVTPYHYTHNNPINRIDPTGMADEDSKEDEKKKSVAIDPGHGDKNDKNNQVDPGAVSGDTKEKDVALKISNATTKELEDKGYSVTQTRTGDVKDAGKKLAWRIKKAKGKDIFVSIHANSNPNKKANGFEVFHNSNGKSLASEISGSVTTFSKNRGIKANSSLYVLKKFDGPSVLVECGFISNSADRTVMTTKSSDIGKQIATGIINYLKKD